MNKYTIALLFIINAMTVAAQNNANTQKQIKGEIIDKPLKADTIYFTNGPIDKKYYEDSLDSAVLQENSYKLTNNLTYPQLYRIYFASDKNILTWRWGTYFIDATTTSLNVNYSSGDCSQINGATANEYQYQFIPFMERGVVHDCKSGYVSGLFADQGKKADSLLLDYVTEYPGSYVALWELIERFDSWGQSAIRQQTLETFSYEIKSSKPWKLLNTDFKHARIKENEKFPDIALKTYDLLPTKLILPKAKYTLIDYWFARCRPCLDTIPVLKKLYIGYKDKGFDIVSISVDETKNIPIWQQRVKEHGLVWTQYLEENNFRVNELGIKVFPTFILLDDKGRIIWRDFDLHELEAFLKKKL